ncbi:MAG: PH domain-containing protein [Chloroflexi bacterium]|nr:PH domain-containing protein [Chloroflexota bacterium]
MRYTKGLLLYQGEPEYGRFLKLIIVALPAALLLASVYLFSSGDNEGGLATLLDVFIVVLIFLAVFPRKYQVYEDHLRIVLGGPFSVKVRFERIKSVEVTNRAAFTINFATRLTGSYVQIVIKNGVGIAITPRDNNQFVENANRSLSEWTSSNIKAQITNK